MLHAGRYLNDKEICYLKELIDQWWQFKAAHSPVFGVHIQLNSLSANHRSA